MENEPRREIRSAIWEDHEQAAQILHDAFGSSAGHNPTWWKDLSDDDSETCVALIDGEVAGVAMCFIRRKVLHSGGIVAYIEDVAVAKEAQGLGIGRMMIEHLTDWAESKDAYKVILSCSQENVAFYEKCGFHNHEITMRKNLKS